MEQEAPKTPKKKYKQVKKLFGRRKDQVLVGIPSGKYQIDTKIPIPPVGLRLLTERGMDLLLHIRQMEVGHSMGFSGDAYGKGEMLRAVGYAYELGYRVAKRVTKNAQGDIVEYRFWVISKS